MTVTNQYVRWPLEGGGDVHWKAPVANAGDLPLLDNQIGDARVAQDSSVIYIWTGSAWFATTGGTGTGTVTSVAVSSSTLSISGSPITTSGTIVVDATGGTNTFAGFDSSGNLFTIPNWNIDATYTPSRFGVNASFQIDPFLTTGYNATNNISNQLVPSADAPNDSEVLLQLSTAIDPTNTGFGIGAPSGLAARILDLNLSAPTSGANGQIQVINIDAGVGDPVITGGSVNSLIPVNLFVHQQQGFSISNLNSVSSDLQLDLGSSVDSINVYGANLQINGSLSNFVGYFQASGNITNTNISTANINMFGSSVQINGHLGDVSIFTDFNTVLATANITAEYNSINLSPSSSSGGVIRSYTGINLDPNFSATPITDDIAGVRISLQNITAGTSLTALDINIDGSTDSSPQGTVGISSNGRINLNATTTLASGQNFQIGNRIESLLHVPSGSPVTGTDSLGNDFAGDLSAEDDLAVGPLGLGWSSVGFIADMAVAVGKTVDAVNVFLPAVSLPNPGYTTGGHVNNLSFIRMFAPLPEGGTVTIDTLYCVKVDPLFGNIGSAATNAWGIWIGDTTVDNWFAKDVVIGGSTGKPSGGAALDVTGTTKLDAGLTGVLQATAGVVSIITSPTFSSLVVNGDLEVHNGHYESTQTTAPTAAVQAGAGTGATSTVSQATDTAGIVNLTTGTITLAAGAQTIITFNSAYAVAPIVVITPNNSVTGLAAVGAYVTATTTTMTFNFGAAGVLNTAYSWNYHVIETQ